MAKETTLECCGSTYSSPEEFARHREDEHGKEGLKCCDNTFGSAEDYAEHQKTAHLAA